MLNIGRFVVLIVLTREVAVDNTISVEINDLITGMFNIVNCIVAEIIMVW